MRYVNRFSAVLTCTAVALGHVGLAQAQDATPAPAYAAFLADAPKHWALLDEYCVGCHNFNDFAGSLALDLLDPETIPADAETWEKVIRKLRGNLMPPPAEPKPLNASVDSFIHWLEGYLDTAAAGQPNPGYVSLHRLNRTEWANEVLRVLGVNITGAPVRGIPVSVARTVDRGNITLNIANLLSPDLALDGFDNIASALNVSPGYIEELLLAARDIARSAVDARDAASQTVSYTGGQTPYYVGGMPLGTVGGATFEHYFATPGQYRISASANGVIVLHNGELIPAGTGNNGVVIEVTEPGLHRFSATRPAAATLPTTDLQGTGTGGFLANTGAPAAPAASGVQIQGPLNPTGLSQTLSRQKIFVCYPQSEAEETACAGRILANLADQAFRGWATPEDAESLMYYYRTGYTEDVIRINGTTNFERGIERAIMALLMHPKFIYRVADTPANAVVGHSYPLSGLELASRLSFFLWREGPDAELLNLAAQGGLNDEQVLAAQVQRMLADPRAMTLVTDFAFKWLEMYKLRDLPPSTTLYAAYSNAIANLMEEEMRQFLASILLGDVPMTDLLSANYTYLNQQLATFYGVQGVVGGHFQRVDLAQNEERWGLLGKGAILVLTSYPDRTSPVIRGAYVLSALLGTPPTPPPPGVEMTLENAGVTGTTVREQLEAHRVDPTCSHCHAIIDPLGLALENFDATGEWRELDRHARLPLDPGGQLADGTPISGVVELREALVGRGDLLVHKVAESLMTYALGRVVDYNDMPAVREIIAETADSGNRFSALVLNIVQSDAFRMKEIPDGSAVTATATQIAAR